jgi:hypothetical protein
MDTRGGKDDIASNMVVRAILLALADLLLNPLVVWLAPSILTLLAWGLLATSFLQRKKERQLD